MIQKDKMEVVQEQQRAFDEVLRENAVHSAISTIKREGEKGVEQVMYETVDNYDSKVEFIKAMTRIAFKAWDEWQKDITNL